MKLLLRWYKNHGTKLICSTIGILEAAREVQGLIPEGHQKWYALAIIILAGGGVGRGFTNSKAQP